MKNQTRPTAATTEDLPTKGAAGVVHRVLREGRLLEAQATIERRQLPAIGVTILTADRIRHAEPNACAVVATIPRADLLTLAIAHRIASDVTVRLAISASSNGRWSQIKSPVIEPGRQNCCVTVTFHCGHPNDAADLVMIVESAARAACALTGQQTHRVVRT